MLVTPRIERACRHRAMHSSSAHSSKYVHPLHAEFGVSLVSSANTRRSLNAAKNRKSRERSTSRRVRRTYIHTCVQSYSLIRSLVRARTSRIARAGYAMIRDFFSRDFIRLRYLNSWRVAFDFDFLSISLSPFLVYEVLSQTRTFPKVHVCAVRASKQIGYLRIFAENDTHALPEAVMSLFLLVFFFFFCRPANGDTKNKKELTTKFSEYDKQGRITSFRIMHRVHYRKCSLILV